MSGYRTTIQPGHHIRTIEKLEYTIKADTRLLRKPLAFSKKRIGASYDSAGSISNQELKDILSTADDLHSSVTAWLRVDHPDLR